MDPTSVATDAASALAARTGVDSHDVAVVLGSGWPAAADALGSPVADLPSTDLPGFAPPAVEGHAGRVRSIDVSGVRTHVFVGRTHHYEEHGMAALAHGVRTAAAAGMTGAPLHHREVLDAGEAAAARMGDLLARVVARI